MILAKCICGSALFVDNPREKDLLVIVDEIGDRSQYRMDGYDVHVVKQKNAGEILYNLYLAQLICEGKLNTMDGSEFPVKPNSQKMLRLAIEHSCFERDLFAYKTFDMVHKHFYWILLVYYYFLHHNTDLTEEEREQVRLAHDGKYKKEDAYQIRDKLISIEAQLYN